MTRTATIALIAAFASGSALAQATTDEDVVVVDPEMETDVEVVEPETDVEVVEAEVVEAETMDVETDMANLIRTRDITGGPIYSTGEEYYDEASWMDTDPMAATDPAAYQPYAYDQNYDNIGSIEDIVLDPSGQMVGIVAEVGGFLDIGDKHVMLPVEDVRLVAVDDQEYSYVTRLTEEQLEELPSVDEGPLD